MAPPNTLRNTTDCHKAAAGGLLRVLSFETVCVQDDGAPVLQSFCDSTKTMWTTSQPQERVHSGEQRLVQSFEPNLVPSSRR